MQLPLLSHLHSFLLFFAFLQKDANLVYLRMDFLGPMAPSSYCLPLASTLQLNCLKDLHHHAASTLLPFMPSQTLGHTHIPTNTTQLLQRQHCTSQCQDSFSYSPFPDHAPLASAGLHFPVFPLLLGVPSISSQGPCPCPDLLVSGGRC